MVHNYQVKVTPGQCSAIGNTLTRSHSHHETMAENVELIPEVETRFDKPLLCYREVVVGRAHKTPFVL